ncbi:hypothetical protein ACF065_32280 [Streptomyces sp. NPDC015232]|uniref:Uncharacterized protein n=2 Tax=Streptomyces TaxID=1883 RepID=G2G9U7_9ACTN|nr:MULTISPECIES: hypothetical protein [Streptomyces]EGX59658.1 hypothetical protein SZN_11338 [Streptomyces zinciresistens K42]MDT0616449.1 hypothetical protein [Streptomyces sp. DSM 40712]
MRTSHRFLLGLVLGTTITVIVWSGTGNAEAAITLGVAVLVLVWLGQFILD